MKGASIMTKRTIKTCSLKTLAIFLSVLMIFYLIPATAYASLFEATEAESVVSEATEYTGEIFEDVSRREENVKHFRLEDGTYMAAQYDTAVHTLDENGEWQDIDNTLSESGSEYSTSNARIKFAKKITGNESIFTLHENNRKITLSLDGAIKKTPGVATNTETEFDETATTLQKMMTLDKLSSRIIYEDILDGVDLEYIVVSNNVKENIIVKEQKDAYSYYFTLKLNNLFASLSSAGDVEITDPDSGEVLYIIPAPVVYDANMTYASETDAYYTLETIGQKEYRLTVTANTSWMNASERAFPVTIDPAIYYGGYGMQQMCDTCVSENYPTGVYGSRTYLKVGYDSANANLKAYVAMRSLPTLPAGSMITKAELNLTYNGTAEGISTANLIANRIYNIVRSVLVGIGQGFQPVAGFNYGAKRPDRVKAAFRFTVVLGTAVACASAVLLALCAPQVMAVFRRDDPEVIRMGALALRLLCVVMPLLGYSTYVNQMLQCLGRAGKATFLASCRQGLLYTPLILILPSVLGFIGIQLTQPIADGLTFLVSVPFHIWFFTSPEGLKKCEK